MLELNEKYWSNRYQQQQTQWDIGAPSTPLKAYIDQVKDLSTAILIPGCGNAYEAEYLLEKGFTQVTLLDISATLIQEVKKKFAGKPIRIIQEDFFDHQGTYDLVLEQTFFCALDPSLRPAYVEKVLQLLKPGGILAGVLFNRAFTGGPPFGGNIETYKQLFCPVFTLCEIEPCYNSIPPRQGTEAFIKMQA